MTLYAEQRHHTTLTQPLPVAPSSPHETLFRTKSFEKTSGESSHGINSQILLNKFECLFSRLTPVVSAPPRLQ